MDRTYFIDRTDVQTPYLITEEKLLSGEPITNVSTSSQNYASIYYQHVMVQMAKIKKELFIKRYSPQAIVDGWTKIYRYNIITTYSFFRL